MAWSRPQVHHQEEPVFALCAAIVIVLALFGIGGFQFMLLLWLGFIALHFAFGWGPISQPWTRRAP